jgi:hypothetical protein
MDFSINAAFNVDTYLSSNLSLQNLSVNEVFPTRANKITLFIIKNF